MYRTVCNNTILGMRALHNSNIQASCVAKSPGGSSHQKKKARRPHTTNSQITGQTATTRVAWWGGGWCDSASVWLAWPCVGWWAVFGWPAPCVAVRRWAMAGGPWGPAKSVYGLWAKSVCGRPGPCVAGQVRVWLARSVCGWPAMLDGWAGWARPGLAGLGWARLA